MKVYKTQVFDKWSRKEGISDTYLRKTVEEVCQGLIDADLGGGLIKKRVPRPGQGKRSSYRTLLAFKTSHRAIFMTGFAKNEVENITQDEKIVFKRLCAVYLGATLNELEAMCKAKKLIEVSYEKR